MANDVITTSVVDGSRVALIEIQITGDGSGEETDTVVVDFSELNSNGNASEVAIRKFAANLSGFTANLNWDASTPLQALTLPEGSSGFDINALFGGPINNRTTTGKTGDIIMTTVGLGAGDAGTILLELIKKP